MLCKSSCVEVSLSVGDVYCEEMEAIRDWGGVLRRKLVRAMPSKRI